MSNEPKAPTWQTEEDAKENYDILCAIKAELEEVELSKHEKLLLGIDATLISILDTLQKRLPPRSEGCSKPEED